LRRLAASGIIAVQGRAKTGSPLAARFAQGTAGESAARVPKVESAGFGRCAWDHGSQYTADDFPQTGQVLGASRRASPSSPNRKRMASLSASTDAGRKQAIHGRIFRKPGRSSGGRGRRVQRSVQPSWRLEKKTGLYVTQKPFSGQPPLKEGRPELQTPGSRQSEAGYPAQGSVQPGKLVGYAMSEAYDKNIMVNGQGAAVSGGQTSIGPPVRSDHPHRPRAVNIAAAMATKEFVRPVRHGKHQW